MPRPAATTMLNSAPDARGVSGGRMIFRWISIIGLLAPAILVGQTASKPPRTPDGQPDLQGIWTNATLTPLQRPPELGNKQYFNEDEAAAFEKQRIQQNDVDRIEGARGEADLARRAYNNVWFDRGNHVVQSRRTSLIIDPPDGRIPAFTPEAQKWFAAVQAHGKEHPADGPEDRYLSERCLLFGSIGPPMLPEPYNNNYEIVQGPGYV